MYVSVYMKSVLKSPQGLHYFRFNYNSIYDFKSQINQNLVYNLVFSNLIYDYIIKI